MKNFTTDAINIKSYPLGEKDNIILMLSKDNGLIRGIAKGTKSPKSKLGARMQILVANKLMMHKGRNLDTISQAQSINTFMKLRSDLDKLTYAIYLGELISTFCEENSSCEEIYDIFYDSLENISNSKDKTNILLNVLKFQLKFMEILGYKIEFTKCLHCGQDIKEQGFFSIQNCGIFCANCKGKALDKIAVPQKITEFLNEISTASLKEKTKYDDLVNEAVCTKCFKLLKRYIEFLSPKKIKSLDVIANF